jgi:hypothetical protein
MPEAIKEVLREDWHRINKFETPAITRATIRQYKEEYGEMPEENEHYKAMLALIESGASYRPKSAREYELCGDLFQFGYVERRIFDKFKYGKTLVGTRFEFRRLWQGIISDADFDLRRKGNK